MSDREFLFLLFVWWPVVMGLMAIGVDAHTAKEFKVMPLVNIVFAAYVYILIMMAPILVRLLLADKRRSK